MSFLLLKKITPLLIACIALGIYLIIQMILSKSYNSFGFLAGYMLILGVLIVIDRILIAKFSWLTISVLEIIFIAAASFWFVYSNRSVEIRVNTSKPYFFILYDKGGLKEKDMPSTSRLLKRSVELNGDSVIYLNKSLEGKEMVVTPKSWNYNSLTIFKDTVINSRSVSINFYYNSKDLSEEDAELLIQKEIEKLR